MAKKDPRQYRVAYSPIIMACVAVMLLAVATVFMVQYVSQPSHVLGVSTVLK